MQKWFIVLCMISFILSATKLPDPDKEGGLPLYEAAAKRMSKRDFTDGEITEKEISQLLWSAYGKADNGHRTVPSSKAKYPFDLYIFLKDGVYKYLPETHEIDLKIEGDHREVAGEQDFVKQASANICFVGDYDKVDHIPDIKGKQQDMNVDTGYVAHDMYMVCASEDLKCVIRAMVDQTKILRLLELGEEKYYVPMCFSAGR